MNNSHEALVEAIRAKCQREHWFGPELLNPTRRTRACTDDPSRFDFVFPPASEEELQATETHLGFLLPPLLHTLYTRIANGGFGPGTGLRGTLDGYGKLGTSFYPNDDGTIVAQYKWRSYKRTFDLTEYVGQEAKQGVRVNIRVPYGEWLEHLLPICDLGCVEEACVDSKEHMFIVAPVDSNEVYCLIQLPWTLEEWLWRWVRGEDIMN